MFFLGCHLSTGKGYLAMGRAALEINANCFQFFSRNPRGSGVKKVNPADVGALLDLAGENGFGPLLAHGPYTLNVCSAKPEVREFAHMVLVEDLERMDRYFPGNLYNFHPGHTGGPDPADGLRRLTDELNRILPKVEKTTVLLETMAGQGSDVGGSFGNLGAVLAGLDEPGKVGICLDTCHVWAAGYDIVNDLDGVLQEFDRHLGLDKLKAIHLNDSVHNRGEGKDRHAAIGKGTIGKEAFARFINHKALRDKPMYLETPHRDLSGWGEEIRELRRLRGKEV